jgi:hypothetical protein
MIIHNIPTKRTPFTIKFVDGKVMTYDEPFIEGPKKNDYLLRVSNVPALCISFKVWNCRLFFDEETPIEYNHECEMN